MNHAEFSFVVIFIDQQFDLSFGIKENQTMFSFFFACFQEFVCSTNGSCQIDGLLRRQCQK